MRGRAAPDVPTALLKLASWQAARCGVRGALVDPESGAQESAAAVLGRLVARLLPALEANGDDHAVLDGLGAIPTEGTGADQRRRRLRSTKGLDGVVRMAVERTTGPAPLSPAPPLRRAVERA